MDAAFIHVQQSYWTTAGLRAGVSGSFAAVSFVSCTLVNAQLLYYAQQTFDPLRTHLQSRQLQQVVRTCWRLDARLASDYCVTVKTVQLCGQVLPHPGHVCAFFDSRDQKYEILLPFLKDAITVGDDVINIVDACDMAAHLDALSEGGVPVRTAVESGKLRVLTSEQTYLQEGHDVLPRLLDFLRATLERAQKEQHCVRTWGEMNWVERDKVPVEDVLEYEARVNELFPDFECTLLCVYDLARLPASLLTDILATHPSAIIKGRLRKNSHYVEPLEYLKMLRTRRK